MAHGREGECSPGPFLGQRRCCSSSTLSEEASAVDLLPTEATENIVDGATQNANALLREVYGPHAKLVVQLAKRRKSANAQPAPQALFRASSTFKLLGFPVELASVTGADQQAVVDCCLDLSLRSDIPFIDPRKKIESGDSSRSARGGKRKQKDSAFVLSPHEMELKAIVDELRELCIHFCRQLKFSMKEPGSGASSDVSSVAPPAAEAADGWGKQTASPLFEATAFDKEAEEHRFRCRVYQKDEWAVVARSLFVLECTGTTPHRALLNALTTMRGRYQAEVEDPILMQEGVRECQQIFQPFGKVVEVEVKLEGKEERGKAKTASSEQVATSSPSSPPDGDAEPGENTSGEEAETAAGDDLDASTQALVEEILQPKLVGLNTYAAEVKVMDRFGNAHLHTLRHQRSPLLAYQSAAHHVLKSELSVLPSSHLLLDKLPPPPLLARLKWQVDLFSHRIAEYVGKTASDIVSIRIGGSSQFVEGTSEADAEPASKQAVHRDLLYTATVTANGDSLLSKTTNAGLYRLSLDAYTLALHYLFDQYADICQFLHQQLGSQECTTFLFPSSALLDEAVKQHDDFSILSAHKGKWNCYAVLGTVTSALLGHYFQTSYHYDAESKEWWAILTVNTGDADEVLIQRCAKMKGEAWKRACVEALRSNFPRQHSDAVRDHPDVDLSLDIFAKSSKYRSLPREKRVEHIANLFAMVCAFAEEDMGWYQPRIRFRNTSAELGFPQWVAELEATVENDSERRIVGVSPPFPQARIAKRVLVWRLAQQYFPKELEVYKTLKRGDGVDPTRSGFTERVYKWYNPGEGLSFVQQLLNMMERDHQTMLPFSWTLKGTEKSSSSDLLGGDYTYLHDAEPPERLMSPVKLKYESSILGNHGDLLISDYKSKRVSTATGGMKEQSAVETFLIALKTASHHLCKADSEAMWIEFETHEPPSVTSSRELCLHLFHALWGNHQYSKMLAAAMDGDGKEEAIASSSDAILDIHALKVGDQWVGTVVLPFMGSLPIARAYGSTKKKCVKDALTLATRECFPGILQYWEKNVATVSDLVKEIMLEPIVSELPDGIVKDLRRQMRYEKRSQHPFQVLLGLFKDQYAGSKQIRIERSKAAGNEYQCRLYMQPCKRLVQKGTTQLIGFGSCRTMEEAFSAASKMAIENLSQR